MIRRRWRIVPWTNKNGYWLLPAKGSRQHVMPAILHFSHHGSLSETPGAPIYTTNWDRLLEETSVVPAAPPAKVPVICEYLLCVVIEPEFHEDRLGDYQERFADLWVPKFGLRLAVVMYVWHVLRQSRLIDWLIRAFGWDDPL